MRERRRDAPTNLPAPRSRTTFTRVLAVRVAALGLVVSGAAVMSMATLGAPVSVPGHFRLIDEQTLPTLPAATGCAGTTVPAIVTTVPAIVTTVPAIVTTVNLPTLPALSTCSTTTQTSAPTASIALANPVIPPGESSSAQAPASGGTARSDITTSHTGTSSRAFTTDSTTSAGVRGADAGTPSTGTDIAFGIGIGLVIAGAGIGTGTGAFLRRRRSTE